MIFEDNYLRESEIESVIMRRHQGLKVYQLLIFFKSRRDSVYSFETREEATLKRDLIINGINKHKRMPFSKLLKSSVKPLASAMGI